MADAPDALDYEYSPEYGRAVPLASLLPGNYTAPPAPLLAADEPTSESPGAFFWTVGLNLALLLLATYSMFVLREKPRTWARRIFFPRLVQERADGVDGEPNSVTALGVGPDLGDDLAFAHRPAEKDAGTPQSSATPTKPSKHWVWSVMELTEEQLYERIGLDGVMFLRLVDIGWQTCTFLALFVGIPLLIVYSTIDEHRFKADVDSWSFFISISNVRKHSDWLFAPVLASYASTILIFSLMSRHNGDMMQYRINSLLQLQRMGPQFYTVLVQDIPDEMLLMEKPVATFRSLAMFKRFLSLEAARESWGSLWKSMRESFSGGVTGGIRRGTADKSTVQRFFERLYPGVTVEVSMVPTTVSELVQAVRHHDALAAQLEAMEADGANMPTWRSNPRRSLDTIEKAVVDGEAGDSIGDADVRQAGVLPEESEAEVATLLNMDQYALLKEECANQRCKVDAMREEMADQLASSAFVTFPTVQAATMASMALHTMDTRAWKCGPAPPPADIDWSGLNARWPEKQIRSVVAYGAVASVCLFFLLPVTFVSGLSTLQNLVNTMPWLAPIARNDFLAGLIEGYLPGVALTVSLLGVPYIFLFLSHYQCVPSYNAQIHSAVVSTFALLIVDVLLGASFIRATFSNLDSLLDSFNTTEFLRAIGYSIPNGAYFFIVLVCAKMGIGLALELVRIVKVLVYALFGLLETEPQDAPFVQNGPWMMFIFLLAITYSTVSPLLVPFAALYFLFSRFLWRNQLLFVYSERRDSMGSLWPYYMHSILVAVILSQVFLAGVLLTKGRRDLMVLMLVLALGSVVHVASFAGTLRAFQQIPLAAAVAIDEAHGPLSQEDMREGVQAYIHPCMRGRNDFAAVKEKFTIYGSIRNFDELPDVDLAPG